MGKQEMTKAHTPGPWTAVHYVGGDCFHIHYGERGNWIADVHIGCDLDGAIADARLIAAAPDLLDAGQAIAPYLGATDANDWRGLDDDDAMTLVVKVRIGDLRALRAAIAKATSEENGK
jgi:hypothetical protein